MSLERFDNTEVLMCQTSSNISITEPTKHEDPVCISSGRFDNTEVLKLHLNPGNMVSWVVEL